MTTSGGNEAWNDADEIKARLAEQVSEAQERATRAQMMRSEIDAVRGRGRSPRGEVIATADASGALVDLKLTDDALELAPHELATLIMKAAGDARRQAGDQSVRITADTFGEDSTAVTMMRDELSRREDARHTGLQY